MSRRSLPLNAIDAFLVTARHLNLTHAAAELCLTQGAVSRKIASLEAWFGFPLFERHARGLRLSPQGSALLPELQSAFEQLLSVADQARSQHTVIRLKAPTCAMRWLVPRLLEVEREHPDLQIALTTTTERAMPSGPSTSSTNSRSCGGNRRTRSATTGAICGCCVP